MSLPVVQRGTVDLIFHDMKSKSIRKYLEELIIKLRKENPLIGQFLVKMYAREPTRDLAVYAGLMVYKLLSSQQEADELKK